MRVGFFGTPGIASYVLERLCSEFEIAFLVAPEDKTAGRNRQLKPCAAKEAAMCRDIPVLQPRSLKDPDFISHIKSFDADIFAVVAYGKIIPEEIFSMPPLGTINLHPSLLPKYRGAAPVQWALINGDRETGVTVQRINMELDAGDIVLQERIPVDENMNAQGLYEKVLPLGAELMIRSIELLGSGEASPVVQNHELATYCGKIDKETASVDWNADASAVHNLVRGMNPKPVAWTTFRGKNLRIWETALFHCDGGEHLEPGEIAVFEKKRLLAGTGGGVIELIRLQPENKKAMNASEFINGQRLQASEKFE